MSNATTSAAKTEIDWGLAIAFMALLLGAVAMGASPIFVRFAASDVSPFASAFWRVALALPALYAWMRIEDAKMPPLAEPPKRFTLYPVLAGFAFIGDLFFWHLAILNTTVANATFFATLTPVYVIGISWLILKMPVSRSTLAGVVICLLGGAILVGKTMSVSPEHLKGDIFGIVTALFFSLYFLAVGRARKNGGRPARITFEQSSVTAAGLLVIALAHSARTGSGFLPMSANGIMALVGLALVSQVGGQGLLTYSMGRLPTVFSSLIIFLEAIVAAFLGWVFLHEDVTGLQCLGGVLILAGIWIARPKPGKPNRNATTAEG